MPQINHHLTNYTTYTLVVAFILLSMACTTTPTPELPPMEQPGPAAYRGDHPRSILVMPPVNMSPDVKAPLSFLASSTEPLAEAGYYVIPVALSDATFKQNGVTVAEEAQMIERSRLREIFGADAALYITITRFGTRYNVLSSLVEAAAYAKLIDLRNGRELWSGQAASTSGDTYINTSSLEGLIATMVSASISQVVNTLADTSHTLGMQATKQLLSAGHKNGIRYGPYHPNFGMD